MYDIYIYIYIVGRNEIYVFTYVDLKDKCTKMDVRIISKYVWDIRININVNLLQII